MLDSIKRYAEFSRLPRCGLQRLMLTLILKYPAQMLEYHLAIQRQNISGHRRGLLICKLVEVDIGRHAHSSLQTGCQIQVCPS